MRFFSLNFLAALLTALFLFGTAQSAYAQDTVQGNTASAGLLVTAALEQVGYHAQAEVLKNLKEHIEWLSALIYLSVILTMLLSLTVMGSFQGALWALVGPALFIWISGVEIGGSKNTIEGAGVEWRFGAFDDTQVTREKEGMLQKPNAGSPGEVSFFFHKYNELVSEIIQKGISIATNNEMRDQMMFMTRQRLLEELFGENIGNADIAALASFFMAHCSTEITYARIIALGNRDPSFRDDPEYKTAKREYCRLIAEPDKPFPPGNWQDYVCSDSFTNKPTFCERHQDPNVMAHDTDVEVSCAELWGWMREGGKLLINEALEQRNLQLISDPAQKVYGNSLWGDILKDLEKKLTDDKYVAAYRTDSPGDPCPNASGSSPKSAGGEGLGSTAQMTIVSDILAGYLIKKSMTYTPVAKIFSRTGTGHAGFAEEWSSAYINSSPIPKASVLRRQSAYQFSKARKYEAYLLMNFLPYLQGILLYALAVAYPFFAVFIIIPGRASVFITWMALWAWVKCWDLGWALLVVADNIIWELMPKAAFINPDNIGAYETPVSLLETAFDGDYAYNISSYWMLLSTMVMGVPIVTGQAVMGAKRAVAGVLFQGIRDFSSQISAAAEIAAGAPQTRAYVQARERDSMTRHSQEAMLSFGAQNADVSGLYSAFGNALISETGAAEKGLRRLTKAHKNLESAGLRALAAQAKLEALGKVGSPQAKAAAQKEYDAANEALKKAQKQYGTEDKAARKFLGDLGDKHAATGNSVAAYIGRKLEERTAGQDPNSSIWNAWEANSQMELILDVLGRDSVEDEAQDEHVEDATLRYQLQIQRKFLLANVLEGLQLRDLGDHKMLLGLPMAFAGYGAAGYPGGMLAANKILDGSAASNASHYQYMYEIANMQARLNQAKNDWRAYEMFSSPEWQQNEVARAYASAVRREHHNRHEPPLEVFWNLQQMRREAEAHFGYLDAREKGMFQRFMMDLGAGAAR